MTMITTTYETSDVSQGVIQCDRCLAEFQGQRRNGQNWMAGGKCIGYNNPNDDSDLCHDCTIAVFGEEESE